MFEYLATRTYWPSLDVIALGISRISWFKPEILLVSRLKEGDSSKGLFGILNYLWAITGTGKGGQSIYGSPFADEIRPTLKVRYCPTNSLATLSDMLELSQFNARGVVACANAGPDTNKSQVRTRQSMLTVHPGADSKVSVLHHLCQTTFARWEIHHFRSVSPGQYLVQPRGVFLNRRSRYSE